MNTGAVKSQLTAQGPPAGLQLSSGRLVVPSYHTTIIHGDGNLAVGHIMFSDDGGGAWSLSQDWGALEFASECQAAEIGPNHLLLNSRSSRPHRVQVESLDGGETFGPVRMSSLKEPITGCEGSMVTFSTFKICSLPFDSDSLVTDGSLWYAGPDTSGYFREKMTLFRSTDNGTNWKVTDQYVLVVPNLSARCSQCLTLVPQHTRRLHSFQGRVLSACGRQAT